VTTDMNTAIWTTGKWRSNPLIGVPSERPPLLPRATINIPLSAAAPAAERPMSRATAHRRASSANTMRRAVIPKEPAS